MKTTDNKLGIIGKTNPFKAPEGYFELVQEQILSQLPEKESRKPQVVSLWERMKPWVYMAAMFTGIMLMVNIFVDRRETNGIFSKDVNSISISEIDDLNSYYEEKMADASYQDVLYEDEIVNLPSN